MPLGKAVTAVRFRLFWLALRTCSSASNVSLSAVRCPRSRRIPTPSLPFLNSLAVVSLLSKGCFGWHSSAVARQSVGHRPRMDGR
ncbi:hypothetical protein KC361_g50 [Hortaea werneckii]|nr:hypothetical protein KC361_g50 [Hortaea werneckii]